MKLVNIKFSFLVILVFNPNISMSQDVDKIRSEFERLAVEYFSDEKYLASIKYSKEECDYDNGEVKEEYSYILLEDEKIYLPSVDVEPFYVQEMMGESLYFIFRRKNSSALDNLLISGKSGASFVELSKLINGLLDGDKNNLALLASFGILLPGANQIIKCSSKFIVVNTSNDSGVRILGGLYGFDGFYFATLRAPLNFQKYLNLEKLGGDVGALELDWSYELSDIIRLYLYSSEIDWSRLKDMGFYLPDGRNEE